jgi:quercetin dioxygenase-like cupin family protein
MIIRILCAAALASPRNGIVAIAGSERAPFNEIVARHLKAIADPRVVVGDPEADTSAAGSRRNRWRRWAKRASAASVWTHESAAHRQKPDPASNVRPVCHGGPGHSKKEVTMTIKLVALVLLYLVSGTAMAEEPKVTPLMSKDLPESPGREALMITVEHAPGGSSAIHRHNAHAFVYVLEGSVVMQLKGGQQVTLTPGQTFYEGPADVHVVDRNASATQPAKFLVLLIKDKGAPALVPAQ